MGLISRGVEDIKHDGVMGANRAVYRIMRAGVSSLLQFTGDSGTNIFDREWDLLLILDGCRADLLFEVAHEYQFLTEINTIRSVGSATPEWIRHTFSSEYSHEIATARYITGNPFSDDLLEPTTFEKLDEVWRDVWDEERNTIPARPITDRVIRAVRSTDSDRIIAHYMQPHEPFLSGTPLKVSGNQGSLWMALREGEFDHELFWQAYCDNLRYVLDDVALLLNNVDVEKVVITSDHGNAFGEYGVYGHPKGYPLDCLREVPWVETAATDCEGYEPEIENQDGGDSVSQRLRDLGYID
jgi:hypothetical protein